MVARFRPEVQNARIEVVQAERPVRGSRPAGMLRRSASVGPDLVVDEEFQQDLGRRRAGVVQTGEGLEFAIIILGAAHAKGHDAHIGRVGMADRHEGRLQVAQFEVLHRRGSGRR